LSEEFRRHIFKFKVERIPPKADRRQPFPKVVFRSTCDTYNGGSMKRNNSTGKKKMLDQLDCQMIELLQKDGRVSNTEIAKKIGISEATVRTRLNRLIEEGYIQIVAVSNPIKLGFEIVGNIRIHVEIKKMGSIIKELKKLKPLWFIVQTTGGTGIDTEFVAKSLDELNELIFEKINKIDGVIKTETSLFLNYIKRQYDWGTALY
jgi:Lrp/AsnC family transcriptional regulator, regulator for asnA, asnC and gidA